MEVQGSCLIFVLISVAACLPNPDHRQVASGRANNNDCPAIARTCPTECYSISSTGCIVCQCPISQAPTQSPASSNSTHTGAAASTSAGNNNGCPSFPTHCDPNCLALDGMGCPICSCPKTPQSAGSQTLTSSGATGSPSKVNGCAPFPRNCSAECARIDSMGCIVCSCPSGSAGQTGKTTAPSSSSSSSSSQGNINGCQPFPKSCRVECAMVDSRGCIVCQCPSTGSSNSSATSSQTATSGGNGINGCPPFPKSCDSSCVKLDDLGCVICSCPHSSNNSSQAQTGVQQTGHYVNIQGQGSAGNGNGCPSLDPNCPAQCTTPDDSGCIRCTCSTSPPSSASQSGSVSSSNAGGCPAIPKNCQLTCLNIDASGCVVCSCPSNAGTSGFGATCPPFKADDCDNVCKMTDAHGCPICDCSQHFSSTTSPLINTNSGGSSSGGGVPGAGGCPTFDFSNCDPACVSVDEHGCMSCSCAATAPPVGGQSTTVGAVTSVPGAGGCPAFDFSTCDPNCVVMDAQGCLSCHCAVTTPATSGGQSNNTSGAVTSVPGAGGCPSFDFSTCDPNCVVMDDKGCLSCSCAAATMAPSGGQSSTSGAVTSVPGAGGCPSFDFSTCDPKCVVMDAQGCMSCTCTVTTQSPSTTNKTTGTTSVPGAGGCSPFDFSTCDPNCVIMDAQGCLSCQCKATTVAPSSQSTVTSVPGAGGCPSFDFNTCDPSCVVMDGQGCMSCHCKASTPSPLSGQTSTIGAVTSVPGAGGCPSFDFGTCDPNCVVMNSQGCLFCHCTGSSTAPPGQTTQQARTTTSVPGAGGCPSFDFSACNPNCVVMDSRGCFTCHCAATTAAASGYTTTSVTSVPGAGGCPSFDFNRCDPACVVMDAQGCMTCSCSGNQSGKSTLVPVLTTTPRHSSTTRPAITSTTVTPRSTTAHAPPTTAGNTCPPIRCTYPCDLGVAFNAQGCPVCKCRSSTASP